MASEKWDRVLDSSESILRSEEIDAKVFETCKIFSIIQHAQSKRCMQPYRMTRIHVC